MSKSVSSSSSSGIGFTGLLAVLFIGLKLTDHIDWSWLWVLSPIWIPIGLVLGILVIIAVGWLVWLFVAWIMDEIARVKRNRN